METITTKKIRLTDEAISAAIDEVYKAEESRLEDGEYTLEVCLPNISMDIIIEIENGWEYGHYDNYFPEILGTCEVTVLGIDIYNEDGELCEAENIKELWGALKELWGVLS